MPAIPLGNNQAPVPLTPRMRLRPAKDWQGHAEVSAPAAAVLGEPPVGVRAQLSLFTPAEPAIELAVQAVPQAGVLGAEEEQAGLLEYSPADDAVYVMLQEVHTPDGIIYDWTLPMPPDTAPTPGVLTGEERRLRFPVNPVIMGDTSGPVAPESVLGLGDAIVDVVTDLAAKRVLQVLKSPIDRALLSAARAIEPAPRVLALREGFQPLEGFEAWRALLPPEHSHRVLLYIHGFCSSIASSGGSAILPQLASNYAAVLGYDHPTLSVDPFQNARELLAMIPDDLRLSVDLVAHSRGGLVARSLVELTEAQENFTPLHLITHGSPHEGTRLADPERWDRLVSLGMTAASWLTTASGALIWLPQVLEYVLKAAAQGIFSLPGLGAMTPGGDFLARLNAPGQQAQLDRLHYAVVTSSFSPLMIREIGFRKAFEALVTQVFMGEENDLVVPTKSMSGIDRGSHVLRPDQQFHAAVDHHSYFRDAGVLDFLRQQLAR